MTSMLKNMRRLLFTDDKTEPLLKLTKRDKPIKRFTERELIQLESQVGAKIFGKLPEGVRRREFFNLDLNTWIWHEEVVDEKGEIKEQTTKYEVQPRGILKIQPNYKYSYLEGAELHNFVLAVKNYYEQVSKRIYNQDPTTGKPI